MERAMSRPPSVFVRELLPDEATRLRSLSRRSSHFAVRQRAQIVLASAARMSAAQIARAVTSDESQVRRVIHDFNANGMDSLRPSSGGGRPRRIDDATRSRIVAIGLARPQDLGDAGMRWSLRRLRSYLLRHRVVSAISVEHLRRILREAGVTYQRTRTWKFSPDPDYEEKKNRVLALYGAAEARTVDGAVVCFDECGPISLCPHPGHAWAPARRPWRQRATFHRRAGVRYLFGAYDVGADRLFGRLTASKDAREVLSFLREIRRRYPPEVRVFIVMDNLSTHWTKEIRDWADDPGTNVELVATPTYASHLNRIECHFWAYVEFVIRASDYPDWETFTEVSRTYLRRRNLEHRHPRIRLLESRRRVA